jgi:hypothetical protein
MSCGPYPAFAATPSSRFASRPSGLQSGVGDLFAASSAVISPCGRYRYRLERDGPGDGRTVVIMVNPSTADAEADDQTIRKLKGFGARNGWGRIIVGNLFAYRATDVRELAAADDPVGPENDERLRAMMMRCERLIFAWGRISKVPRRLQDRWRSVLQRTPHWLVPHCIGETTACGHPPHPLTLGYDRPIVEWRPPR